MLDRFDRLAEQLEADAAAIRRRAASASAKSMNPMRTEAAALERAAQRIRDQIAECERQSEDAP